MRYVIIGAGAIGGGIGGRLAAAGLDVTLVARGRHLEAIRAGGLELRTPEGTQRVAVGTAGDVASAGPAPGDVVVMAVKSHDTAAVLRELVAVGERELAVVCAQNGVDSERQALRHFDSVYGICVLMPATYLDPGVIELADGLPGVLDIGRYPAGDDAVAAAVAADLRQAGFRSDPHPAIMTRKYRKLLANLANVLDAASGSDGRARSLARAAKLEAMACLDAAGVEVGSEEEDRERRRGMVGGRRLSGSPSSSRQSLARGVGSIETDWLNGEIVLLGRLHGVPTPVNELLVALADRLLRESPRPGSLPVAEVERWAAERGVVADRLTA